MKFNLQADPAIINKVMVLLSLIEFDDQDLWFQGEAEVLQEKGFKQLAKAFPAAALQCPLIICCPWLIAILYRFENNWEHINPGG